MHSFTVNCDTFSNEEEVAIVAQVMRQRVLKFVLYFVGNVSDETTGMVSITVNGWLCFRLMSI